MNTANGNIKRRKSANPQLRAVLDAQGQPVRFGLVSILINEQSGKYFTSHWCSKMNRPIRKSAKTTDLAHALTLAASLDKILRQLGTVGYAAVNVPTVPTFTLTQALDMGITHSRGSKAYIGNMERHKGYFLAFMQKRFPTVTNWVDLLPLHLDAYCRHLAHSPITKEGFARDTGRSSRTQVAYLDVVRAASSVLSRNYPTLYRPLAVRPAIYKTARARKAYLQPAQMIELLEHAMKQPDRRLAWAVVLGTWGGMRFSEIAARTADDVRGDCVVVHDKGKITGGKTHYSPRVVPLCKPALDAAKILLAEQKVVNISGAPNKLIHGLGENKLRDYFKRMLNSAGLDIQPREAARKSYANMLKVAGVREEIRKGLMGWAFRDVAGAHYEDWAIHPEDTPEIAGPKLKLLRVHGVDLVNAFISQESIKKTFDSASVRDMPIAVTD
jgi:hypothetical protein